MITRAELEYLTRVPNELRKLNETLKELVELLKTLLENEQVEHRTDDRL